jgi:hypothetical protein
MLFSGETGHGKSKLTEIIQALGGGAKIPTDSCQSTDKAFMAHMTAYCGFSVHMQDYDDRFMATMRSLYDRVMYSKKRKTIRDETYDPIVNAAVIMTAENTPSGRSLINRCVYIDYNTVLRDEKLAPAYDEWWHRMVEERRAFGFLKHVIKTDLTAAIVARANTLRKIVVSGNERLEIEPATSIESRIALNYSIIYGAFAVLYAMPEVRGVFDEAEAQAVKDKKDPVQEGLKFGAKDIVSEIRGIVNKAQSTSHAQGTLDTFFSLFQSVYFQNHIGDMVTVSWDAKEGIGTLRFQLDPVLNEVLAYDRRTGQNKMGSMKKGDIESRIRKDLRIDPEQVGGATVYTLPLEDLHAEYGVTFRKIDDLSHKPNTPF